MTTGKEYLVIQCTADNGVLLGLQAVRVHPRAVCKGRSVPCCIHSPSNHKMISWQQNWRDEDSYMERICPHGFCHPDPDHVAFITYVRGHCSTTHDCDGCCN